MYVILGMAAGAILAITGTVRYRVYLETKLKSAQEEIELLANVVHKLAAREPPAAKRDRERPLKSQPIRSQPVEAKPLLH